MPPFLLSSPRNGVAPNRRPDRIADMMRNMILGAAVLWLGVVGAALAQDTVPQSETQIKLSYAPLVKQAAPAVVNIYTKKVIKDRASPFFDDPFFQQF